MAKVLITGATGFVGSHTAEYFRNMGHEVIALVRNETRISALPEGVRPVVGSLFRPEEYAPLLGEIDYFVHIAGLTKARRKEDFYRVNAESVRILLAAVEKFAGSGFKRFFLLASQAGTRPSEKPLPEDAEPAPLTHYGKSKMLGEQYARQFMDRLPISIIRAPAVYGPRDRDIYFYFRLAAMGFLPLVGDPDRKVSLIYVKDLARAIYLVTTDPRSEGEVFFVTDGTPHTWREFAEHIDRAIPRKKIKIRLPGWIMYVAALVDVSTSFLLRKAPLLYFARVGELLGNWVADDTRIRQKLGFKEEYPLERGVPETTKWYREHGWI